MKDDHLPRHALRSFSSIGDAGESESHARTSMIGSRSGSGRRFSRWRGCGERSATARPSLPPDVGNTPLVKLNLAWAALPPEVHIFAKCEYRNEGGSSKARIAHYMLSSALRDGRVRAGQTLLIPTSGNTGLACASFAAQHRLSVALVMAENVTPERQAYAAYLGAQVILTPAALGSDGAYQHAQSLAERQPDQFCLIDQYTDLSNVQAHYETTGPEIWRARAGRVTHFVAGFGTGGTLSGVGRALKQRNPAIQIVAALPAAADEPIPGLRHLGSAMTPPIFDPSLIDAYVPVTTAEAEATARLCARHEGRMVGPSSGAALHAALHVASRLREGWLVVLFPDGIDKYSSAGLRR